MFAARMKEISEQSAHKMTPNVFQTALKPDNEKGQPRLSFTQLVADAGLFFAAGTLLLSNDNTILH